MLDQLFGRRPRLEFPLQPALARVIERAAAFQHVELDPLLVRARLADRLRDADTPPPSPRLFDQLAPTSDAEAMRRIAVLTSVLGIFPRSGLRERGGEAVVHAVLDLARTYDLHEIDLLRRAPLRAEELVRVLAKALDVGIVGETARASAERLELLDYKRLVREVDRARAGAADRVAYLSKLHEDLAPRGRGKF
jgi:hypothetical protein